ncbi:hypothetical protein SK128_018214 [Halocaridina rubra]|uniref:Uncharacterized protein n=1 Tax=Halocaridina rubra TaxID=373956 RepID=A0AAN8WBU9_HALRR
MRTSALLTVITGLLFGIFTISSEAKREGRFAWVNPDTPTILGIIVGIPLGALIPVNKIFDMKGDKFDGRGFHTEPLHQSVVLYSEEPASPLELYWDPAYEQQLTRLVAYFSHLQVNSLVCQEKILCEVAAEPETYSVISDMFLRAVRPLHGPVTMSQDSLMWRYMAAAREGFTGSLSDCAVAYQNCHTTANRILNVPVLKVWRYIVTKLNIKLL